MIKKLFTFWKKREKPVINWWSTIEGVEKVTPILPAKEVIPDWWKRVERNLNPSDPKNKGTIRNCPSMPEFLSQGFVVTLWTDLYVNIEADKFQWKTPDKIFSFSSHPNIQFKDWLPRHIQDNSSMVLKPNCPWRVKTPPGWSVWQLPMYYHYNPMFEVLPGIIWSDIHHEINQQIFYISNDDEILIKKGTPLNYLVPFKRSEELELEIVNYTDVQDQIYTNWYKVFSKFKNGYLK